VSRAFFRAAVFFTPRERRTQPQTAGRGLTGFAGSIFIALFVIFCYFMLLGIKIFMAGEILEREVEEPFGFDFFCRPPEFMPQAAESDGDRALRKYSRRVSELLCEKTGCND